MPQVTVTVVRPVTFTIELPDDLSIREKQSLIHQKAEELLDQENFQIITTCDDDQELVE